MGREKALAKLRKDKGYTQERLAYESGVSVKTIQLWEMTGTKQANISTLSKVAKTLGVEIPEILC